MNPGCKTPSLAYYHYTTSRIFPTLLKIPFAGKGFLSFDWFGYFCNRRLHNRGDYFRVQFLHALRANQSRLTAGESGFLKIRMFTGPVGRIVMTAQKLSRANHDRPFRANSASPHNGIIVAVFCLLVKPRTFLRVSQFTRCS